MKTKYQIGDRVMIASEWRGSTCHCSKMDKWLGKTMTIRDITSADGFNVTYWMVEDVHEYTGNHKPGWAWDESWIDGRADDVDQSAFLQMLGGLDE